MSLDQCWAADWALTAVFTFAVFVLWAFKQDIYLHPLFRLFIAVLLAWYLADYLFLAYFVDVTAQEGTAWVIAFIIVAIVFLILYYADSSPLALGLVVLMSSYGLIWYAATFLSLLVSAFAVYIVWRNEIEYLGMLMMDAIILGTDLTAGSVSLFTDIPPVHGPNNCTHVNMLVVCDATCGTLLTDPGINLPGYAWGLIVLALAIARFLVVYIRRVCGNENTLKQDYEQENPRSRKCCRCASTDGPCFMCWIACCGPPVQRYELVSETDVTAEEQHGNTKPKRKPQRQLLNLEQPKKSSLRQVQQQQQPQVELEPRQPTQDLKRQSQQKTTVSLEDELDELL